MSLTEPLHCQKEDGVANAIECIYRDLEYARSLIPSPTDTEKEIGDSARHEDEDAGDIAKALAKNLDRADRLSAKENDSDAGSVKSRKEGGKKKKRSKEGGEPTDSPSGSSSSEQKANAAGNEGSRTASSSDEGWEVMSRGSTAESGVSVSRGSSATRSRQESAGADASNQDNQEHGKEGPGLTAKVLSMLGKPISHTK